MKHKLLEDLDKNKILHVECMRISGNDEYTETFSTYRVDDLLSSNYIIIHENNYYIYFTFFGIGLIYRLTIESIKPIVIQKLKTNDKY